MHDTQQEPSENAGINSCDATLIIYMLHPQSSRMVSGIFQRIHLEWYLVYFRVGLPVANAKLVPKKKPEAAALFKP